MRKGTRIKRQLENRKRARLRAEAAKNAPPKKWVPSYVQMRLDSSTMKVGGHMEKDSMLKMLPEDDVFFAEQFVPLPYELDDIVSIFRQTHAPDMLDQPDALLELFIEFDLRTVKRTKFVSPFEGILHEMQHELNLPTKRVVIAIVPDPENQEKALNAGASLAGSTDLIRDLQKGKLKMDDFDEIVVHGSMLVQMAPLRGILKKHFPSKQRGNYGTDIATLVSRFVSGVSYEMKRDDFDPSYGWTQFPFARLNMNEEQIRENLQASLNRLESHKSATPGAGVRFLRKVFVKCKSESQEKLLLKHWTVLKDYTDPYLELVSEENKEEEIKPPASYFKEVRYQKATFTDDRVPLDDSVISKVKMV